MTVNNWGVFYKKWAFLLIAACTPANEIQSDEGLALVEQGYESLENSMTAMQENPELMNQFPFAPGYLDLIEEWLRGLQP